MPDDTDVLTLDALVAEAESHARVLYDGKQVAHRSCGIALAETFGRSTAPYQALRRGGITGCGECGAIKAGELILGEILGDPDPTGPVSDALRTAAIRYRDLWQARVDRGDAPGSDIVCNTLTGQFDAFGGPARHAFCTALAATVAGCVAQTLAEAGVVVDVAELPSR